MSDVVIRKAAVAEAREVLDLLWTARAEIPLADNFHSGRNLKWFIDECRYQRVWVAIHLGKISGALLVMGDELFYLVVAKESRRSGIARSLLAKGKRPGSWCRINPANKAAMILVESEGFVRSDQLVGNDWIPYKYQSS